MASVIYTTAKLAIAQGNLNLETASFKAMLVATTPAYTPDAAHQYVSSASGSEISCTGYTGGYGGSGRKALNLTCSISGTNIVIGIANPYTTTWTALGAASGLYVSGVVILVEAGGSDATSTMLAYIELADTAINGGDFTIQWSASGILVLA